MGFFTDTSRLHRLQGLRGRVQGVERRPRRRARASRASPTTTPARSARAPGGTSRSSSSGSRSRVQQADARARTAASRTRLALADVLRRLQALHARRLPRRLPDRRAVPHRVRHRRRAGRRLQRLRLLRPGLPVRRDRPARGATARACEVHALLRPAQGRRSSPACAQACPTDSIQFGDARRAARARADERLEKLHEQGVERGAALRRATRTTASAAFGAFFLLLDEPEVYGLPPDPVVTTRDLAVDLGRRGRRRGSACRRRDRGVRGSRCPGVRRSLVGRAEFALLLRAADHQAAGLEARRSRSTSSSAACRGPPRLLALGARLTAERAAAVAGRARRRSRPAIVRRCC